MKKGSLVVIGSGIKSVGHITLEARGWIAESDVVVYCVADPATEIWIKENSRRHVDLYQFYGNDKKRIDTYNDMVDEMLRHVRKGRATCAVFYGHPGVFVHPSHKAIEIARSEGYRATMMPAISALDCLYADLGVDPSLVGSQTFEASDLLLRKRPVITDSHVIIWQIGCVGDFGFNFAGYENNHLGTLVDYLETFYNGNHEVTHYQGAQYPVCPPCIERMPLKDLRNANVTGISTLYIPPMTKRATDREMAIKLGLIVEKNRNPTKKTDSGDKSKIKKKDKLFNYYMPTPDSNGLATYISDLIQSPIILSEFNKDPEISSAIFADLSDQEKEAILSKNPGKIRIAMKAPINTHLHSIHKLHEDVC